MAKSAKDAAGEAVSNQSQALMVTGDGDVSGPLSLALSQTAQDEAMREFIEELHRVQEGFGELTKPGDIRKMDRPFDIVDGLTITDFVDKKTGEIKTKHIFKLQFPEGDIKLVMQSDAGPRASVANLFTKARLLGVRLVSGPYKFVEKDVNQMQPANILERQAGFYTGPVNQRPVLAR